MGARVPMNIALSRFGYLWGGGVECWLQKLGINAYNALGCSGPDELNDQRSFWAPNDNDPRKKAFDPRVANL